MRGVNKVILVGHLGRDPEVRYLDGGAAVANFSIATSESYTNKQGERVDQTEWHNIVLWRGLAETAEKYLHKGSKIYVEGKLRTRSWDDKEGNKRYTTEIVGDSFVMLDKREDNPEQGAQNWQAQQPAQPAANPQGGVEQPMQQQPTAGTPATPDPSLGGPQPPASPALDPPATPSAADLATGTTGQETPGQAGDDLPF